MIGFKRLFDKLGVSDTRKTQPADEEALRIATCAILLEMARIDGEFSETEREAILSIFREQYGLSDEDAEALVAAAGQELGESLDLWNFTNTINEQYSMEEKIRIVELVWRVAYSDSRLDKHEDYLVHKLAKLLRLHHSELIEAKRRATGKTRSS
jgi:uncharacterized tellurite resistance protein B-like protein